MPRASASCSLHSPSDAVNSSGIRGLTSRQPERGRHQRLVTGRKRLRGLRQHPRRTRHGLDPARHDHGGIAGLDHPRRVHRGLQAAPAQPVHGDARHRDRQARQQHGHPPDVAVVLARTVRAAQDHVVDVTGVEARRPVEYAANHGRREVVGPAAGQPSGVPPERRAETGVHERITHGGRGSGRPVAGAPGGRRRDPTRTPPRTPTGLGWWLPGFPYEDLFVPLFSVHPTRAGRGRAETGGT